MQWAPLRRCAHWELLSKREAGLLQPPSPRGNVALDSFAQMSNGAPPGPRMIRSRLQLLQRREPAASVRGSPGWMKCHLRHGLGLRRGSVPTTLQVVLLVFQNGSRAALCRDPAASTNRCVLSTVTPKCCVALPDGASRLRTGASRCGLRWRGMALRGHLRGTRHPNQRDLRTKHRLEPPSSGYSALWCDRCRGRRCGPYDWPYLVLGVLSTALVEPGC